MKIETLVFFDVETIGMRNGPFVRSNYPPTIFQLSLNALKEKGLQKAPYIAELAFVAVRCYPYFDLASKQMQRILRFQLEDKLETENIYVSCNPEIHVRMMPKVYSCLLKPHGISKDRWDGFNDDRLRVKRHIGKILFSKEELNSWNTLEEEWPKIHDFLKDLPKPICILAHNGYQHDFPLLAYEFIRNRIVHSGFLNDMYFVDTLRMLDTLECSRFEKAAKKLNIDLKFELEEQKRNPLEAILDKFYQIAQSNSNSVFTSLKNFTLVQNWSEGGKLRFVEAISYTAYRQTWKRDKKKNDETVMDMDIRKQWSRSGVFGLPYLYNKFIGRNQMHRAQADCEALLKVCLVFGEEFLEYIHSNKNRVTWNDLNRDIQDSGSQSFVDFYAEQEDSLCQPFFKEPKENPDSDEENDIELCLAHSLMAFEQAQSTRKSSRTSSDLFENSQEKKVTNSIGRERLHENFLDCDLDSGSQKRLVQTPKKRANEEVVNLEHSDNLLEVKENVKKAKKTPNAEVLEILEIDSSEDIQIVSYGPDLLKRVKESQESPMDFRGPSKALPSTGYTQKSRMEFDNLKNSHKSSSSNKRRSKSAFVLQ